MIRKETCSICSKPCGTCEQMEIGTGYDYHRWVCSEHRTVFSPEEQKQRLKQRGLNL